MGNSEEVVSAAGQSLMDAFASYYAGVIECQPVESWELDLVGVGSGGNGNLSPCTRAFREVDGWRMFLLLSPYRLVRILVPPQDHADTAEWLRLVRGHGASGLGPLVSIVVNQGQRKAHVQFHDHLGLHFLEPLVLNVAGFINNDAVFLAHEKIIETRDAIMARTGRVCSTQTEISRRELFSPFARIVRQQ
ncbi:MAG: hypothetical protein HQL78_06360 [Magnetococcales bacterium]|nr:hypothetical protein [Magnetococcales bacterium]